MSLLANIAATTTAGLLIAFVLDRWRSNAKHLPPGPTGLPFIGNLLQLPRKNAHVAFRDMGRMYGDVMALRVPGLTCLILNSCEAISDLLGGRSAIYSDRPRSIMGRELAGFEGAVAMLNNTLRYRACRRLLQKGLGPSAAQSYVPFLNRQSALFLEDLQKRPEDFAHVVKRNVAAFSAKVAYGYDGITEDEDLYQLAHKANEHFAQTAVLGEWLVDLIPILRYVPKWFPLADFQRYAARAKPVVLESVNKPFEETKRHMDSGTIGPSFASMLLQAHSGDPEEEYCIKWSSAGILMGSMDTTTSLMSWFFLAMALYPDVQAKAQAEIDKVIGGERLPRIEDKEVLPYVSAVMKEVFRWHPVVPLIPHALSTDDEYRGYFIPAGTAVVANAWAILHDENIYHDPENFIPERFFEGVPDSLDYAFGFGRRACPGQHFAKAHIFVSIAAALATFDVKKARDARGIVIEPRLQTVIHRALGRFISPRILSI
ncbi:cytochrome P450 [Phanerochaete sordida]|uniref:Cytochrome P450 n=1 Tax=Phanerochaete sordida TaxID=48140 RepID=A0A9P3LA53_9APHY|nr:cytochrome P450 [Phanerochaete sordida]